MKSASKTDHPFLVNDEDLQPENLLYFHRRAAEMRSEAMTAMMRSFGRAVLRLFKRDRRLPASSLSHSA